MPKSCIFMAADISCEYYSAVFEKGSVDMFSLSRKKTRIVLLVKSNKGVTFLSETGSWSTGSAIRR